MDYDERARITEYRIIYGILALVLSVGVYSLLQQDNQVKQENPLEKIVKNQDNALRSGLNK